MPTESKFLNLCLTILVQWCISPIMKPCRACAWLTRLGHIRYQLLRNGSNCFFWTLNICSTKYMFLHTILFIHSVRTCLCKSVEIIYHYDIISIFIILIKKVNVLTISSLIFLCNCATKLCSSSRREFKLTTSASFLKWNHIIIFMFRSH
jgi:hypothetical protein